MLELNGYKYSREKFEGYAHRVKFEFEVFGQTHTSNMDIYTDNPYRQNVLEIINARKSDKVLSISLANWTTKEQDESTAKFIDETLKDL